MPKSFKDIVNEVNNNNFQARETARDIKFPARVIQPQAERVTLKELADKPEKQQESFLSRASGALDTVFGGGKIGEFIGNKVGKALAPEDQKQYWDDGPSMKQLAGDAVEVGANFIPASKAFKGLNAAGKFKNFFKTAVGTGAVVGGADAASEGGDINEGAKTGAIFGGAFSGAVKGVSKLVSGLGNRVKDLLPALTGTNKESIQRGIDNPDDFLNVIKRGDEGALETLYEDRQSVQALRDAINKEAKTEYADMTNMYKPTKRGEIKMSDRGFSQTNTYMVNGQPVDINIDLSKPLNEIDEFLELENIKKTRDGFDFSGTSLSLNKNAKKELNTIYSAIENTENLSLEGLENLTKAIDERINDIGEAGQNKNLKRILGQVKGYVDDYKDTLLVDFGIANERYLNKKADEAILDVVLNAKPVSSKNSGKAANELKTETNIEQAFKNLFASDKDNKISRVEDLLKKTEQPDMVTRQAAREFFRDSRSGALVDTFKALIRLGIPVSTWGRIIGEYGRVKNKAIMPAMEVFNKLDKPTQTIIIRSIVEGNELED